MHTWPLRPKRACQFLFLVGENQLPGQLVDLSYTCSSGQSALVGHRELSFVVPIKFTWHSCRCSFSKALLVQGNALWPIWQCLSQVA